MKRKDRVSFIKKDKFYNALKTVIISLVTGLLGFAVGWLFDGRFMLSIVVFSIMAISLLVAWLLSLSYEKSVSVLEILNDDIKHERYQDAVKLGYSVSRALFLSGKNQERYRISEKVREALDKIDGTIVINETVQSVSLLKAKLLIDDCGWSLYLLNRFNNRKSAESRIKEGINECLRLSVSETETSKTYPIVFKGIRHLLGMSLTNFDETPKSVLQNDQSRLTAYVDDICMYGGLLGFLLGDARMANLEDREYYLKVFSEISLGGKNGEDFFDGLKGWCSPPQVKPSFILSTYSFRTKYFLMRNNALILAGKPTNVDYLQYAKELAIKMTLGYAGTQSDFDWLSKTISFSYDIKKIEPEYCYVTPDSDRFVKGYVLLGTVAMQLNDLQSLEDARTAFIKAVAQSKKVNRTDSYISAQRKLISVNERIFKLKMSLNSLDEEDSQEAIQGLLVSMEGILKETKQYLGYSDSKMEKSCKERRQQYLKLQKKLKSSPKHGDNN